MENKSFIVDCGIYPMDIYCFFSDKEYMFEKLEKVTTKEGLDFFKILVEDKKSGGGFFFNNDDNTSVIHVFNIPKNINELAWLQHEILHAVFRVHKTVGMKLKNSSEESYCYLLDYLTTKIYKELNIKFSCLPIQD